MAITACDLKHYTSETICEEQLSGLGTRAYWFRKDDLSAEPEFDEAKAGFYSDASFKFKASKGFFKMDLKPESNKIASVSNGKRKGFKNTATFVLDAPGVDADVNCRGLNNANVGCLIEDGMGGFFVLYNPQRQGVFSLSGDTGDTADSDSQMTITFEVVQLYPKIRWTGTPTIDGAVPA